MNSLNKKEMVKKYKDFKKLKKSYMHYEARLKSEILKLFLKVKEEKIISEIRRSDCKYYLSMFTKGVPYKALQSHGLCSLHRLSSMSKTQLEKYSGIGSISSSRITYAVSKAINKIRSEYKFKFSEVHKTRNEIALLSLLGDVHLKKEAYKVVEAHKALDDELKDAKKVLNKYNFFIRKLLFKRNKEKLENALDELNKIQSKDQYKDYYEAITHILIPNPSLDARALFDQNVSSIYSLLEYYTDNGKTYDSVYSFAPKELIKKIEETELNLDVFNATLRKYQVFGTQFIVQQKNVLLGDEMGLGKTIQAIATMSHYHMNGLKRFVVICPASVLYNWKREIMVHSQLEPIVFNTPVASIGHLDHWRKNGGVLIITFAKAHRLNSLLDQINMLTIDEAHYIKNKNAKRSMNAYELIDKSSSTLLMTGTPLENNFDEFKTLLNLVNPYNAIRLNQTQYYDNPRKFRYDISPIYLRRNRLEVLKELPNLNQFERWVESSYDKSKSYIEALKKRNFMYMRRAAWIEGDASDTPKMNALKELYFEAIQNNRKIIIFSYFLDVINIIHQEFKEYALPPITGQTSSKERLEIVSHFSNTSHKNVLISQIVSGGVGLNIQSANMVILCEPQLKPSTEVQAIGRVYRMGQTRDVLVYRLLTQNSVDEHLMKIINSKQLIFDTFAKDSTLNSEYRETSNTIDTNPMDYVIEQESKRLNIS